MSNNKYHIGKDGIPSKCTASKKGCPYGVNAPHFETFQEAAAFSDKKLESEYGLFNDDKENYESQARELSSSISDVFGGENENTAYLNDSPVKDVMNRMYNGNITKGGRGEPGLRTEIGVAIAYAQELNCQNQLIYTKDRELLMGYREDYPYDQNAMTNHILDTTHTAIEEKLTSLGSKMPKNGLVHDVYFSDDGNTIIAHMGGSGVLDLAIIKNGKAEFIEIKTINKGNGAQTDSSVMGVNEDGKFTSGFEQTTEKTKIALGKMNIKETIGTNIPLNLSHEDSAENLITSYKHKGADKFVFRTKQNKLLEVNLNAPTEDIMKTLEDNNIQCTMKVRSNQQAHKPNKEDLKRLRKKRGEYFKSGKWPEDGKFKVSDLKQEYRNIKENPTCEGYATIGEIVLPIRKSDSKNITDDTVFSEDNIRVRSAQLIGEITDITNSQNERKKEQYLQKNGY